ncbi:MAG TPA: DNA primase [Candidatus Binataceae bacterium]|nr:DNA primase [Candidatus Binataceae bacterium]
MMGRFGEDKIEEVRERADIVEVIGAHVRLKRTGRNFVGLCPFHQEKTPSFSVNAERGFFHCFGCNAGGSIFNFIMKMEGLTFPEAVRSLAQRYGIELPEEQYGGGPSKSERDSMYLANQTAAEFFSHVLWKTPEGEPPREYLESRGIGRETAQAFRIGFAPARAVALTRALERRGLREAGVKLGLVKRDAEGSRDMFRARLMFPIRDVQGRVVAFGGRVLDDRQPKYLNSPESPLYSKTRTIYGLYEARATIAAKDRAILVEGYIDAITLAQADFKEAVAGCGTALTVEQLRLLGRHTKNVIACFDGDEAGRKASLRALGIFLQAGLLGRGIFIPAGFDPDTFIREHGGGAFKQLADSAELLIDYFLEEQSRHASRSLEARARAAERVAEILKLVTNRFEFELLASRAASILGIGEEILRREGRGGRGGIQQAVTPPRARIQSADAGTRAEIGLVSIALLHPQLRLQIAETEVAKDFADPELAAALVEICASDKPHAAMEAWIAEHLNAEQLSQFSAAAVGPLIEDLEHARVLVADYTTALERRRHQREVDLLKRDVAEASAGGASDDEAWEKAQALISLRRASDPRR